jgi:hypothetical protein
MRKYKIIVGGRGGECYIHHIDTNQKVSLLSEGVEDDKMESEQIAEVLEVDFVTDSDEVYLGPYNDPEVYLITVIDENDNVVWESDNNHKFSDEEWEYKYTDADVLIVEDYIKGQFYNYEIELEQDFDPTKLTAIVTEIGERLEVITDLAYSGVELKSYKEIGDYWSKGISYYIN